MSELTGRELDAEVAEKVMGWKSNGSHSIEGLDIYVNGVWLRDWRPSASIAAAWLVVEEMRRRGLSVQMILNKPGESAAIYINDIVAYDRSTPTAICKSALAVLAAAGGAGG